MNEVLAISKELLSAIELLSSGTPNEKDLDIFNDVTTKTKKDKIIFLVFLFCKLFKNKYVSMKKNEFYK